MVQILKSEVTGRGITVTLMNLTPTHLPEVKLPNEMVCVLPGKTVKDAEKFIGRYPNARIVRIIDHEPIITPKTTAAIAEGKRTFAEVSCLQRLTDNKGRWFIDDYGFYLYAVCILSLTGEDVDQDRTVPVTVPAENSTPCKKESVLLA